MVGSRGEPRGKKRKGVRVIVKRNLTKTVVDARNGRLEGGREKSDFKIPSTGGEQKFAVYP